ncbi:MAG: DNA repair protein RecN, partial [Chloroflexi bacterium]|nr:DNA repair protein RecN [Chloroflexota bacterium]
MLFELSISNLTIIDALRLQFEPGFNLLTGETGTGKSIIIDAVTLLLGGRASTEDIRTGAESAVVEGVFLLSPETQARLDAALQEYGLADDAGQLILRREISRSRRSICRVNGRAVPLSVLQEIGGHLIDIHGQGEHLSLLQVRHHIDFLDRYGELSGQREAFGALARELGQVRSALNALRRDERELARRMDLLTYQVDEIAAARLQVGEDQELRKRRTLIANAEKRMELASKLYTLLYEGEERQRAVVDLLGAISEDLAELAKLDDTLSEPRQIAESALYQLEDLARTIRRYRDEVEYDPAELESIEERLELIQSLRRKYGESIPEILEFARRAQAELESISHSEERLEALAERESALLQELAVAGEDLSKARQQAAERLCRAVEAELADLNMERAQFLVRLERVEARDGVPLGDKRYAFDETGIDRVEFFIAPNPGEEPKPLAKTASGGE